VGQGSALHAYQLTPSVLGSGVAADATRAAGVARGSGTLHARLYAEGVARQRAATAAALPAAAAPRTGTMPATGGARGRRPTSCSGPRVRAELEAPPLLLA
jgi:hypothetical protein